jgi:hypothetical protein
MEHQSRIEPERLVFNDETWTKTNMAPLRGWAARGARLVAKVPHGHWKTMTFVAALRHDRIEAPFVIDGPINQNLCREGAGTGACAWRPRDHGQSWQPQGKSHSPGDPVSRRQAVLSSQIFARSEPGTYTTQECTSYFTNAGYGRT